MPSRGFKAILSAAIFSAGMITGAYLTQKGYNDIVELQNTALENNYNLTFKISGICQDRIKKYQQQLEQAVINCQTELEQNSATVCNNADIFFPGKKEPLAGNQVWRSFEGHYITGYCQLTAYNIKNLCP
ncbi:MAG TPA: hypothetical protein VJH68_05120 [Candidatus Nanoarchaeia archaeon]|nr:hypothetical protein [Candidatus Nanoarchaeia archaeon]